MAVALYILTGATLRCERTNSARYPRARSHSYGVRRTCVSAGAVTAAVTADGRLLMFYLLLSKCEVRG